MHTIFLALGSNVGNKEQNISQAISLLKKKIVITDEAALYTTKPMYFEDQDQFVNTALKGQTRLSLHDTLQYVKDIEKQVGRKKRFRNGPREIDIDILFYERLVYKDEIVEVPHPRIAERDFVLRPLTDIDPDFIHPIFKISITELLQRLPKELLTVVPKN